MADFKRLEGLIFYLKNRGFRTRDRLFNKLMEEVGEYCEAVEFQNGSSRKVAKFSGENPDEKVAEEISDVLMMAFALLNYHEISIDDAVERMIRKLDGHEINYRREKIESIKHLFEDVEDFCSALSFKAWQKEIIYFMIYMIQEEFFVSAYYDVYSRALYITYEEVIIKVYHDGHMKFLSGDKLIEEKKLEIGEQSIVYLSKLLEESNENRYA